MFANLIGANRQQQERERTLAASVLESMESQLIAVYGEKEMLETEIGVSDALGIVALVKALEERVQHHEPDFNARAEAKGESTGEAAEGSAANTGLQDLSHRIRILTGTVTSMEAQLVDVYADRELLYREAGIQETQDVLTRMRENKAMRGQIAAMETQLAGLYAQKHTLQEGLGVSDAREVVALVRGISDAVGTAHQSVRALLPKQAPRRPVANGHKRVVLKIVPTPDAPASPTQEAPVRIDSDND